MFIVDVYVLRISVYNIGNTLTCMDAASIP